MSNKNNNANQDKEVNIIIKDPGLQKRSMEIPPTPKIKPKEQTQDKKD